MLHMILTLLKVIGIILLAILALVLLVLLILLFTPLRYQADVKWGEQAADGRYVQVSATWLLHLVSFRFRYENGAKSGGLRIAWKTIRHFGGQQKQEVRKEAEEDAEDELLDDFYEPELIEEKPVEQPAEKPSLPSARKEAEKKAAKKAEKIKQKTEKTERKAEKKSDKVEQKTGKKPAKKPDPKRKNKLETAFAKIASVPAMIGRAISAFWEAVWYSEDRIDAFVRKIEELMRRIRPFTDAEAMSLYRKVWSWLKDLLRHCRVRRIRGRLEFGTGDAALTGWLTGILYILLPASGEEFEMTPDFYELRLDADAAMKGRIRLIHPTIFAVKILLQKEFRTLLKRRHRS